MDKIIIINASDCLNPKHVDFGCHEGTGLQRGHEKSDLNITALRGPCWLFCFIKEAFAVLNRMEKENPEVFSVYLSVVNDTFRLQQTVPDSQWVKLNDFSTLRWCTNVPKQPFWFFFFHFQYSVQ